MPQRETFHIIIKHQLATNRNGGPGDVIRGGAWITLQDVCAARGRLQHLLQVLACQAAHGSSLGTVEGITCTEAKVGFVAVILLLLLIYYNYI